ncbi:MAG: hypothetical protein HC902_00030 [Calothrix sp. SM1_5_4]|nr:hypothetical protein [Calothrix sp. SM1_5_4]
MPRPFALPTALAELPNGDLIIASDTTDSLEVISRRENTEGPSRRREYATGAQYSGGARTMMLRGVLPILFLFLSGAAGAQDFSFAGAASDGKKGGYTLGGEFHIGYPNLKLTNPDGTEAYYDGVAIRGNLNIPIYKGSFDVFLSPGAKYLDLENVASTRDQYESSNIIALGAGLSFRIKYLWFGAKYFQNWGRHFTTGDLSHRISYQLNGLEYFGGLYFRFERLGIGLAYSNQRSEIGKDDSGLNSNTPYDENLYSLQLTYDVGESLWSILSNLF